MIESDKESLAEIMVGYGEMYNKPMTKSLMRVYFMTLKQYSLEEIENAMIKHSKDPKHGSYMPKTADIIRQIDIDKPSVDCRAELAWMTIEKKISSVGAYGKLKIDDLQALAAAQALGSWRDLCHTDVDKLQWKRKEFIDAYKNFESAPIELLPNHLVGIIESDRAKKAIDKPARFLSEMKNKIGVNNGNS